MGHGRSVGSEAPIGETKSVFDLDAFWNDEDEQDR